MLMISEHGRQIVEVESDPSADGIERRRDVRIFEKRPVKVFDGAAAKYFGGQTEDISSTGLRLELPGSAPIQAGDSLSIHVGLNRKGESLANRRQMIPAKVIWGEPPGPAHQRPDRSRDRIPVEHRGPSGCRLTNHAALGAGGVHPRAGRQKDGPEAGVIVGAHGCVPMNVAYGRTPWAHRRVPLRAASAYPLSSSTSPASSGHIRLTTTSALPTDNSFRHPF